MNIVSIPRFLEILWEHQLLDSGPWHEAAALLPPDVSHEEMTTWLLQRGLVTEFQAQYLRTDHVSQLVVGPYRLLDKLGEGGLCEVFLARQLPSGRLVALKMLHPQLQDHLTAREQLRQEMEIAAQLHHPRFLQAIDVVPGRPYFAMEYAAGVDLQRIVEKLGPLPPHQACDYIHQASLGLQYAFEQGLVHRDVKPANLIVSFEGEQVYVLDIGLARLEWDFRGIATEAAETDALLMGTPDFVAPEQALDPAKADVRADIYSLGCTLFYLVTGRPPFVADTLPQKLLHHQITPPPNPRDLHPDLPASLGQLILKMLAKQPRDRFQTPAAVAVALSPFIRKTAVRLSLKSLIPDRPLATRSAYTPPPPGLTPAPFVPAIDPTPIPLTDTPLPLELEPISDDEWVLELPSTLEPAIEAPPPRPVVVTPFEPPPPPPRTRDAEERRRESRRGGHLIAVLVSRTSEGNDPLRGWVLDRSPGGLGLLLEEALEQGDTVYVRPAAETFGPRWFPIRVVHCQPQRMRWKIGCQFLERLSWADLRFFG